MPDVIMFTESLCKTGKREGLPFKKKSMWHYQRYLKRLAVDKTDYCTELMSLSEAEMRYGDTCLSDDEPDRLVAVITFLPKREANQ